MMIGVTFSIDTHVSGYTPPPPNRTRTASTRSTSYIYAARIRVYKDSTYAMRVCARGR